MSPIPNADIDDPPTHPRTDGLQGCEVGTDWQNVDGCTSVKKEWL